MPFSPIAVLPTEDAHGSEAAVQAPNTPVAEQTLAKEDHHNLKQSPADIFGPLRDEEVFHLSYNEVISLSSKAHTKFRRPLENTKETPLDVNDLLLNETLSGSSVDGNHAPWIGARVNGKHLDVILDTD